MSAAEFVTPSVVYSAAFPALAAGTASTAALATFKAGCSRICGLQLVTAGGAPVPAKLNVNVAAAAANSVGPVLTLVGDNGDTSIYRVFWRTEATASLTAC